MNEIEITYHYSKEYEGSDIEYVREHASSEEVSLKLNNVVLFKGGEHLFDQVDGFILACRKLLTYFTIRYKYVIDIEYDD